MSKQQGQKKLFQTDRFNNTTIQREILFQEKRDLPLPYHGKRQVISSYNQRIDADRTFKRDE